MFDVAKSSLPTTYPLVIKREFFVVQDARPLYHWPEKAIAVTKHDNWEPQFKPAAPVRPKSATVVAAVVAMVEQPKALPVTPQMPGVDGEEDDEEYEDDDAGAAVEGVDGEGGENIVDAVAGGGGGAEYGDPDNIIAEGYDNVAQEDIGDVGVYDGRVPQYDGDFEPAVEGEEAFQQDDS